MLVLRGRLLLAPFKKALENWWSRRRAEEERFMIDVNLFWRRSSTSDCAKPLIRSHNEITNENLELTNWLPIAYQKVKNQPLFHIEQKRNDARRTKQWRPSSAIFAFIFEGGS